MATELLQTQATLSTSQAAVTPPKHLSDVASDSANAVMDDPWLDRSEARSQPLGDFSERSRGGQGDGSHDAYPGYRSSNAIDIRRGDDSDIGGGDDESGRSQGAACGCLKQKSLQKNDKERKRSEGGGDGS